MQQAQDAAEIEEVDGEQLVWPDFDVFNPTAQLFVPSNLPQVKSCRSRIVRCVQMNQLASAISMIKKLTLSVRADETDVAYKGDDRDSLMITLTADFRVEDSMYLDE